MVLHPRVTHRAPDAVTPNTFYDHPTVGAYPHHILHNHPGPGEHALTQFTVTPTCSPQSRPRTVDLAGAGDAVGRMSWARWSQAVPRQPQRMCRAFRVQSDRIATDTLRYMPFA